MSNKPLTIEEPTELEYLRVFLKKVKFEDKEFDTYYAHECDDKGNEYTRKVIDSETGEEKNIPVYISVRFTNNCNAKLVYEKAKFPILVALDVTNNDYFITKDKDKDGKPRTRSDGSEIDVCIIRNYVSQKHFDLPSKSLKDFR